MGLALIQKHNFLSILVLFIKWSTEIDYNSQFNQIDPWT